MPEIENGAIILARVIRESMQRFSTKKLIMTNLLTFEIKLII